MILFSGLLSLFSFHYCMIQLLSFIIEIVIVKMIMN